MVKYKAGIDWIVGVIRTGPEYKTYGDPFIFVCTVLIYNQEAFIMGALGDYSRDVFRAIKHELVDVHKCTKIHWNKQNNIPRKVLKDYA